MKRKNYISWPELFIGTAKLVAQRSKDPNSQVGAVIVNSNNIIVGTGYNGMPNGIPDDNPTTFPWSPNDNFLKSKYTYVVHAELNAILNTLDRSQLSGATMYCTLAPCNECMKAIIQAGIKKVIFLDNKYINQDFTIAASRMATEVGIEFIQYEENV